MQEDKKLTTLGFGIPNKLVPLDLGDMNYKDQIHGWVEQDVCIFCGYKTRIREYYQKGVSDGEIHCE